MPQAYHTLNVCPYSCHCTMSLITFWCKVPPFWYACQCLLIAWVAPHNEIDAIVSRYNPFGPGAAYIQVRAWSMETKYWTTLSQDSWHNVALYDLPWQMADEIHTLLVRCRRCKYIGVFRLGIVDVGWGWHSARVVCLKVRERIKELDFQDEILQQGLWHQDSRQRNTCMHHPTHPFNPPYSITIIVHYACESEIPCHW